MSQKNIRSIAFACIVASLMLCLLMYIIQQTGNYMGARRIYDKVKEKVYTKDTSDKVQGEYNPPLVEDVAKNIRELMESNENMIGWITIEGINIDYPVMQADNDDYYLTHIYDGTESSSGSIFIDSSSTIEDAHFIIYGHNMKDLSMFGNLRYYTKDLKYFTEHPIIRIITKSDIRTYQIFSVYTSDINDAAYQCFDSHGYNSAVYQKWIGNINVKSKYLSDVVAKADKQTITLSTCLGQGNKRYLINAIRIE